MNSLRWLLFSLIFTTSTLAYGHSRIMPNAALNPRSSNSGLKVGPCGGVARITPMQHLPGATITVDWQETVQHPGRYEFYFSPANDSNFVLLKTVPDTQDGVGDIPHNYSTTLTLPNVVCDTCTIQLIQVMTEDPANPSLYFSCADVKLTSTPGTNPPPPPAPPPPSGQSCH
jgi:hypothetical protein